MVNKLSLDCLRLSYVTTVAVLRSVEPVVAVLTYRIDSMAEVVNMATLRNISSCLVITGIGPDRKVEGRAVTTLQNYCENSRVKWSLIAETLQC